MLANLFCTAALVWGHLKFEGEVAFVFPLPLAGKEGFRLGMGFLTVQKRLWT